MSGEITWASGPQDAFRPGQETAVIRWEDPPPDRRGRRDGARLDHQGIASALRGRPGQWALVAVGASQSLARDIAAGNRYGAYLPMGSFEATHRLLDGITHTYARYVGELVRVAEGSDNTAVSWP